MMGRGHHSLKQLTVTEPIYTVELQNKTFSMVSEMMDAQDNNVGETEVVLAFDALIAPAMKNPWWSIYKAYLTDMKGLPGPIRGTSGARGIRQKSVGGRIRNGRMHPA